MNHSFVWLCPCCDLSGSCSKVSVHGTFVRFLLLPEFPKQQGACWNQSFHRFQWDHNIVFSHGATHILKVENLIICDGKCCGMSLKQRSGIAQFRNFITFNFMNGQVMVRFGEWMNKNQTKNEKPWPHSDSDTWKTSKNIQKLRVCGPVCDFLRTPITRSFPCDLFSPSGFVLGVALLHFALWFPVLKVLADELAQAVHAGAYRLNPPVHKTLSQSRHRILRLLRTKFDWSGRPARAANGIGVHSRVYPSAAQTREENFWSVVQLPVPVTADYAKPKHWQHPPRSTTNSVIQYAG